uniref:ULP_PROTEASE domain-containing protein n=1 Tax=Panagrellus redivivus TaxID=6233 RepID=A0A7E4ZRI7_PANRE
MILCILFIIDGISATNETDSDILVRTLQDSKVFNNITDTLSQVADDNDTDPETDEKALAKSRHTSAIIWIVAFSTISLIFIVTILICIVLVIKTIRDARNGDPAIPKTSKTPNKKKSTGSKTPQNAPLPTSEVHHESIPPTPLIEEQPTEIVIVPKGTSSSKATPSTTDNEVQAAKNLKALSPKIAKRPAKSKPKAKAKAQPKTQNPVKVQEHVPSDCDYSKSQPYDMVLKFVEDAPRNLNRHNMLRFKGVMPREVGSRLDPFLQMVFSEYNTSPPRHVVDFELNFFLLYVKDAMKAADGLLKKARQDLSRHGAIYEQKQWKSFNDKTKQYISRVTTPGFYAWYAFAGEHGNEIKFSKKPAEIEATLNKMSIPALLIVFFRLELDESIRKGAYIRIRHRMPQIANLYPRIQLRGMAYPICLIPELEDRDPQLFADFDNTTGNESTQKTKEFDDDEFDKAIEKALPTDETQVSHSDGRKNAFTESVETEIPTKTKTDTTINVTMDMP